MPGGLGSWPPGAWWRRRPRRWAHRWAGQRGNALVETALVLPLLLLPAFGVVGVGRLVQAQMGASAVVREAARAAALAESPAAAAAAGLARAEQVAAGYRLANGSLRVSVDTPSLARGAPVRAAATYDVGLGDLPLLGWVRLRVASDHVERVDLYRSRRAAGGGP